MKQVKFKLPLRALTLAGGLLLTASSFAQTNAIKGHVKDASGEPIKPHAASEYSAKIS